MNRAVAIKYFFIIVVSFAEIGVYAKATVSESIVVAVPNLSEDQKMAEREARQKFLEHPENYIGSDQNIVYANCRITKLIQASPYKIISGIKAGLDNIHNDSWNFEFAVQCTKSNTGVDVSHADDSAVVDSRESVKKTSSDAIRGGNNLKAHVNQVNGK